MRYLGENDTYNVEVGETTPKPRPGPVVVVAGSMPPPPRPSSAAIFQQTQAEALKKVEAIQREQTAIRGFMQQNKTAYEETAQVFRREQADVLNKATDLALQLAQSVAALEQKRRAAPNQYEKNRIERQIRALKAQVNPQIDALYERTRSLDKGIVRAKQSAKVVDQAIAKTEREAQVAINKAIEDAGKLAAQRVMESGNVFEDVHRAGSMVATERE